MEQTRAGKLDSLRRGAISWSIFLLLSLVVMIVALARMDAAGPGGQVRDGRPIAGSGALGLNVGQEPSIHAPAAYLFDAESGFVLYSKNADDERAQASTTKVMTALLAVERGNLDQTVRVGADAEALVRADSSYMGLSAGEQLTLRDLLYGLMLPSGNDAAVAIADAIGGSVSKFVAMMNNRAAEMGLTHTHFVTPHGLDAPGHHTSARDLAVLSAVAMKNPTLVKITSTKEYDIPKTATHKAYQLVTGNDLLAGARSPYPGAIGVKPGYTGPAGFCMAFAAIRHGRLIVGAVLGDSSWQVRITDMRSLLDWGFEQEGIPAAPPAIPWSIPSPNI